MPNVARSSGVDTVSSPHGTGRGCSSPTTQATAEGVSKGYVENCMQVSASLLAR